MAIKCQACGKEYDVTLFQFGRSIRCDCGQIVHPGSESIWDEIKKILGEAEENNLKLLQGMVDRVCSLIVASDYPEVDIDLEIEKVRNKCTELFPNKTALFDLIYLSRFKRLWEQFR